MNRLEIDLRQVERLVDAVLLLRSGDAVLAGLGEVEAAASGGAQLGDHLLVVRQRDLDVDAGLLLEHRHDVVGRIAAPGEQPQFLGLRHAADDQQRRNGDEGRPDAGKVPFHVRCLPADCGPGRTDRAASHAIPYRFVHRPRKLRRLCQSCVTGPARPATIYRRETRCRDMGAPARTASGRGGDRGQADGPGGETPVDAATTRRRSSPGACRHSRSRCRAGRRRGSRRSGWRPARSAGRS